jgi:thiamine biosynthesis lipoprotein
VPDRKLTIAPTQSGFAARFQAMGSPCEVLSEALSEAEARTLGQRVADEAWRIEDKFSRYIAGNIVDQLNRAGGAPVTVDAETANLLNFAQVLHELSDGMFDITSGALRKVWRFDGGDQVPTASAVSKILKRVGWHRVKWSEPVLRMSAGMEIDFGGIGKEFAVDSATAILRDRTETACLVNFGGDLAVTGVPARKQAWVVGIEALAPAAAETLIELKMGALATSGDARRYLLKDGIRYSHVLDPHSGWPITDAASSITVAADTCTQAGMLSTLAMLKGAGAEEFLAQQSENSWCRR